MQHTAPIKDYRTLEEIAQNPDGIIIVLDATQDQFDSNVLFLQTISQKFGNRLHNESIVVQVIFNKMDLPEKNRIRTVEIVEMLNQFEIKSNISKEQNQIIEVSALSARKSVTTLIKQKNFDPSDRPESVVYINELIQTMIFKLHNKTVTNRELQQDSMKPEPKETNGVKHIIIVGPSGAGKKTIMSIFYAIRKRELPEDVYQFLKLDSSSKQNNQPYIETYRDKNTGTTFNYGLNIISLAQIDKES